MKSPHYFIVKPLNEQRYNSESNGLIVNVSLEDHNFTQRLAEIIQVPIGYDGPAEVGDTLVVGHNTFRIYYDNKGYQRESKYHIQDNLFYVEPELSYMVIKRNSNNYIALEPYCFVEPLKKDYEYEGVKEEEQFGVLKYANTDMLSKGFKNGDKIGFMKDSEYEFNIEDQKLYMMKQRRVLMIC
jgi:hypothetical protein